MGLPDGVYACDGLLFRAEHIVLPWIAKRISGMEGRHFGDGTFPASAIGVLGRDPATGADRIMGGVAYSFWFDHPEGGDCQISAAFDPGARITRRMWRHLYGHAFITMNCRRMSMQTRKSHRAMRRHVERAGWILEGVKPEGDGRHDLVLYGLLRRHLRNGLPPIKNLRSARHG